MSSTLPWIHKPAPTNKHPQAEFSFAESHILSPRGTQLLQQQQLKQLRGQSRETVLLALASSTQAVETISSMISFAG